MNLILFEKPFEECTLAADDPRAVHLRKVLRAEPGTRVFLGFEDGPRARAEVVGLEADGRVLLKVAGAEPAPPRLPLTLLAGLPRPHTAKRILSEAASLGVRAIHFFEAERGEPSYARSRLWRDGEWKERVRLGVEQSFGTRMPDVAVHPDLQTAMTTHYEVPARVALDNYEAGEALGGALSEGAAEAALAFGPERGWSPDERDALRRNGWRLAHLGPQVLRSETAVVAAVGAAASALGLWKDPTRTVL